MVAAVAVAALAALSNTAEITSTNIRDGAALDNIKASWNQALKLGDFSSSMRCNYDRNANKDFLKDVSFSGDLVEAASGDDVKVSYEVTHSFADKSTNVKLSANSQGTTLGAEVDDRQLQEVSAERDVDFSGTTVNVQPSWLVKAKTARVKLMSSLGKDNDKVSAQVDYDTNAGEVGGVELGYEHNLEDGRDVSATFKPADKDLEVEYVDNKFEDGATWTATASVPLESSGSNLLDSAKVTLKRAWSW